MCIRDRLLQLVTAHLKDMSQLMIEDLAGFGSLRITLHTAQYDCPAQPASAPCGQTRRAVPSAGEMPPMPPNAYSANPKIRFKKAHFLK